MATPESIALELLEYKVADMLAKRTVRGGTEAMWELLAQITRGSTTLSRDERERFEEVGRRMRLTTDPSRGSAETAGNLESLVIGSEVGVELVDDAASAPTRRVERPEVRDEMAVLQRIARRVWWDSLDEFVLKVAASWRAERDRYTARLMYATLQNLQRNSVRKTFGQDVNLRSFQVREAIPEVPDPLVSLSDVDSLAEIVREMINTVMTMGKSGSPFPTLQVADSAALTYVRSAAMLIAQDPYAGRLSLIERPGPSSKQLRLAIQELGKERLPENERGKHRRELERRLADTLAFERNQRQLFQRDVLQFSDLVHAFFERLADYLPTSVGGRGSGPQLEGGVLFGVNPMLRWESVPPGADALTVHLVGPVRFTLASHEIAVMGTGPSRTLYIDEREVPLQPRMALELGRSRLSVFHEGDYVHFRYRDEARSLAVRLAEALVVFYVLSSPRREDLLTVLKVLSNTVQGEPQDLVARAAARAASVSARAPNRRQAVDGLVRGAARAAGVGLEENVVLGLVQRFVDAMTVVPTDVAGVLERVPSAEAGVRQLTGEPLTVDLSSQKITVRQYRGRGSEAQESLVAMLPGQVLGSFTDYLLVPLAEGTLILVRGEQELAFMHVPDVSIETSRAL